jgi:hypothetical protein
MHTLHGLFKKFTVKFLLLLMGCMAASLLRAQELYPYSEPASNMPAHSLAAKLGAMYQREWHDNRLVQRYSPEVMLGLNKAWMVHAAVTVSDMHQRAFIGESVRLYAKYRFLSKDDVHKHFRMAAFALGSYSRNHIDHNELNLFGDQTGVQAGLIATQLLNKLAISGTGSMVEILDSDRWKKELANAFAWRSFNYSLSAGYLLFPLNYTSYKQTNINLYAELLGSRNLGLPAETYFVDLAPSIQFIFSSTAKLNLGYRFQLAGNINRLAKRSVMVSYEHIFLNALRKKKSGK